jgi:carbamoyl-phosphate synthase small subunit
MLRTSSDPTAALLVLEDGRVFRGEPFGARGEAFGEAVFATGMTGYQETLTDPSYHRQVVVQTAPHIGNTGVNDEDGESARIWVAGYVVRDPARRASSWRARRTLDDELVAAGVVGISDIDTRALTRHLRARGAMRVGISSTTASPDALLDGVLASPQMTGADLAREVTTPAPYLVPARGRKRFTVVAVDLGIKAMTPRRMAERGIEVQVVPAISTAAEILDRSPDGVFFSNGPGDPAATSYAVEAVRGVLDARVPVFGICLGHQLLGRALGLDTYKLPYGHRGINQPVLDRAAGRVEVTAHNHGFAVAAPGSRVGEGHLAPRDSAQGTRHNHRGGARKALVGSDTEHGGVEVSHLSLNDGVVEGLRCLDRPAFSVQYHPEAAAGPHDATHLFARFTALMEGLGRD